ncbi:MAG: 50S ribosomal protein L24 [Deferribacterota bacterium]|nr:50S ribosomal protein L24 [Deferribacterota bacterium]
MQGKYKLKKDDSVIVTVGRDKDKISKIINVNRKKGKVIVENVNIAKKHTKPTQENPDGGIIEKTMPIDISNVMYYCKKCKGGVRLGYTYLKEGKKSRYCKKCGEIIDK